MAVDKNHFTKGMFKETKNYSKICRVLPPKKSELLIMRSLISIGVLSIIVFLWWFYSENRMGYAYLYWPLTIILFFKFLRTLHEWYHYFHVSVPTPPGNITRNYKVDVLTTACPGEPKEMIIQTLKAMQRIKYPHTSYLCDEGDDPELKEACRQLGVNHVTRKEKVNAKAGNINNALKRADGDIAIVLDPDHIPVPEFIDRVLPYFEDPQIGFVQSVQAYYNRAESLVAFGACEQTYHFYGPMMMCMNTYGTAQAIGANCAFRREALDSIGGHAPGLAEDMHTSMLLHAKGWKSVYVPEILTKGLVPASLPAYYKQQLKWSRGTFDLLFKVIPKIFSKLTFRQKIHYLSIPLYFFYGIIDFLNILIPIATLFLAEFPWQVDLVEFIRFSMPILVMTLLIRQYAQIWLLEKHERGFHMVGGLLRIGTWWVFALGFIYTLFNVKVPYIPTPKDGEPENSWSLSIPNLIVCLLSITAICYGLYIDWNPYTFFMAGLAFVNVLTLGFIVIIGQQKFLHSIYYKIQSTVANNYIHPSRLLWWNFRHAIYFFLRKGSFYAGILTLVFIATWFVEEDKEIAYYSIDPNASKVPLKLYKGINYASFNNGLSNKSIRQVDQGFDITCHEIKTDYKDIDSVDEKINKAIQSTLFYPMISIKYSKKELDKELTENNSIKLYYETLAESIKNVSRPIFLNPFPDPRIFSDKGSFKEHWRTIHDIFNNKGVSNVIWVWSADKILESAFPGSDYVDWISTSLYKSSYKSDYSIFRSKLSDNEFSDIPIIVQFKTEDSLASTTIDTEKIIKEVRQLKGVHALVFSDDISKIKGIKSADKHPNFIGCFNETKKGLKPKFIQGERGNFKLMVDEKPFYIKAVAYHSPGFMSEGHIPLTRSQLKRDFSNISKMGANTIRRFDPSVYDKNILSVANEEKLKVIYGFNFSPDIDYVADSVKMSEYVEKVRSAVEQYKGNSTILGWSLGNNAYADLKYYYDKPQLLEERQAYLNFIERLALLIKKLDPEHPVVAILSHSKELSCAVRDMHRFVPSADIIGYNCHDEGELKSLYSVTEKYDKDRPYLISELSHGFTNTQANCRRFVCEKTDHEKANEYFWNWIRYVEFKKGYNIGGIAYSWKDRQEGFYTRSGLTDFKGRYKPSYYKLARIWKNQSTVNPMPWVYITGPQVVESQKNYNFGVAEEFVGEYKYEWYLQTFEISNGLGKIEEVGEGAELEFFVPENTSSFRLYLYVSDNSGNVVSYSQPIKVREPEFTE